MDHLTIPALRKAIDAADEIILRALEARFRAVESLHELKKSAGMPVEDIKREDQIKAHWKASAHDHRISEPLALLILDFILAESKRIQNSPA